MSSRRALAIGCGGTLGFAWTAAVLRSVEEELGWDPRTAEVLIGTSAGSELVGALGAGYSATDLLGALTGDPAVPALLRRHVAAHPGVLPPVPQPRPGAPGLLVSAARGRVDLMTGLAGLLPRGSGDATWLRDFATGLADPATGWVAHPQTWLVAADTRSGARLAFGAPKAPQSSLADAMAASWGVPGWFPPVAIAGREYVDGGAVSPTSADLLLDRGLDEVVIIAPMATHGGVPGRGLARIERLVRRWMTATVDAEERRLRQAGIRVIRIEPGAEELGAMGPNFMDHRRRAETVDVTLRTAPGRVRAAIKRSTA